MVRAVNKCATERNNDSKYRLLLTAVSKSYAARGNNNNGLSRPSDTEVEQFGISLLPKFFSLLHAPMGQNPAFSHGAMLRCSYEQATATAYCRCTLRHELWMGQVEVEVEVLLCEGEQDAQEDGL
jgi:hypothetical protein